MTTVVTDIPAIMRANKLNKAAAVMDRWFSLPGNAHPESGVHDLKTITMDWVLGFHRAKVAYQKAIKQKVWVNDAAKRQIVRMLHRKGHFGGNFCAQKGTRVPFGRFHLTVDRLDADYIQFRPIGDGYAYYSGYYPGYYPSAYSRGTKAAEAGYVDYLRGFDDFTAAIGRSAFRFVVAGTVTKGDAGMWDVEIRKVGIYLRDSYDFNESQHLGFWDKSDNSISIANFASGTRMTNADFRAWRQKTAKGGDYLIFTDLKVHKTDDRFSVISHGSSYMVYGQTELITPNYCSARCPEVPGP